MCRSSSTFRPVEQACTAAGLERMSGQRWDVFCRVVDNYGDAAVCWRLARQLAVEHGLAVRLWLDDLGTLRRLNPRICAEAAAQQVEGVDIRPWQALQSPGNYDAPDVAIEAFGCGLPDACTQAMAQRRPSTLWITLEYLSAESWVGSHHGLPSPHPRLPLQRYYFFPGFAGGTGGLLREQGLLDKRQALQFDAAAGERFWTALGYAPPPAQARVVSLFGYENPAAATLLDIWTGDDPVVAVVPPSRLRPEVATFFGAGDPADGSTRRRGNVEARFIPFLPQSRYDELLWLCHWNFVRGEDSFVRAQWAARPLVWHIYPQQQGAHWPKLNAFLERYAEGLEADLAAALKAFWQGWNGGSPASMAAAWRTLAAHGKALEDHSLAWSSRLAGQGDLAGNLVQFCRSKVK